MRQLPFGTAEREVLLKFTAPQWTDGTWSRTTGRSLYENRALTDAICQGLVRHGYLAETVKDGVSHYTLTTAGQQQAWGIEPSY